MADSKKDFLYSLDLIDQEVEQYIPFILEDLWELGSMPGYILQLIRRNIDPATICKVIDLGCGKGAVLIKLAMEMEFCGVGIDIVPQFIEKAKQYARQYQVAHQLQFISGDITHWISHLHANDLVIYGHDSGILGNIEEALLKLSNCLNEQGWIILETAFTADNTEPIDGLPTYSEVENQVSNSGFIPVERIVWDTDQLKKVNAQNNTLIQSRIDHLVAKHPHKTELFNKYMENQLSECRQLESHVICSTWLLRRQHI